MNGRVVGAVALSILTATFYAFGNLLEMLEAEKVESTHALKPGLVMRLVRRPRWLLGITCDASGYVCHAGALALATVVFVEPILAVGILLTLVIGSLLAHRPVHRRDWIAALVLSGGLALFLVEVEPTGGHPTGATAHWLVAGPACAAIVIVCAVWGRLARGARRATLFGVAAGIVFGASALLTKALDHYLASGPFGWVAHWEPYALGCTAALGIVFGQSALQTGALGAAVGAIESTTVITGSVLGIALLDERVGSQSAAHIAGVVVAAGAILFGIVRLAAAEEQLFDDLAEEVSRGRARPPQAPTNPHERD